MPNHCLILSMPGDYPPSAFYTFLPSRPPRYATGGWRGAGQPNSFGIIIGGTGGDGQPARGYGGTADVVACARGHGKPVRVIWPAGAERG